MPGQVEIVQAEDRPTACNDESAHAQVQALSMQTTSPGTRGLQRDNGRSRKCDLQILTCKNPDNVIRWIEGERLDHLFEQRCDQLGATSEAVVTVHGTYTFLDIDRRANQLARYLIEQGARAGDRIGLIFDRSVDTYVALLAVLKVNATYVPLDGGYPEERIAFIQRDANLRVFISQSQFKEKFAKVSVPCIFVDSLKYQISAKSSARLTDREKFAPKNELAYIIYTSGTTGTPKGVAVEHSSICNFVRVAAEVYGMRPGDRCYQGMTIAFDFSVEEIWVPLLAGATLVPSTQGVNLVGDELADFLRDQRVTCLCCCPTLLATIERELPQLRILLVGGEPCPQNLVTRWHRAGRKILNSYGPTEATVTATLTELRPNKPVTIGRPLPTYSIVILDPVANRVLPHGECGEIGIAGVGLAAGYLNQHELTRMKFIPDFLDIPNNPSKRIYRTGDLGRINHENEIVYLGRKDTQVKIRGYRIELVEIESVLMELPQIAQVAVGTYEAVPGINELVAYYSLKKDNFLSHSEIWQALRCRLPAYMVPAFLEELPFIPMLISNKADHKKLPRPKCSRLPNGRTVIAAKTENERILSRALAEVLNVDHVSVDDNFFNDLGAHSLLMARFCAKMRQSQILSNVSMRDIYLYPTIAKLADHLGNAAGEDSVTAKAGPFHIPSNFAYYGCGALQLLFYGGYSLVGLWIVAAGFSWIYAATGSPIELYLRSASFALAAFIALSAIPVAAKWLLIGRWKAESIPIWSLRYFRFWVVKTLVQGSPMAAFVGSPIYNIYLRLLGAKIGRNAVIATRFVPVATDLFAVGDDTILRKNSILLGYKAQSNFIHIGSITIGNHAFVGEASVVDIDTAMANRTQLGHASSLQSGQRVSNGKHYHGSPALETKADYCPIDRKRCSPFRRASYACFQLVSLLGIIVPIPVLIMNYWYPYFSHFAGNANVNFEKPALAFIYLMLLASAGLFIGLLVIGLLGIYLIPRVCHRFLKVGKTYALYGLHYWLQRVVWRVSNSQVHNLLFGDSSLIVHYMRLVGWKLNKVEQTGSNFGTNQWHDNPFLCEVGSGTMVSDGLSMINMHMSNSSFRLCNTRVGAHNYLGNDIHYPPGGRTGANCLLGTKVMIPIDGPVRENIGLLGSPSFEIPRIVERDKNLKAALSAETRRQRIRQKNAHNLVTATLFLVTRWAFLFVALMIIHLAVLNYQRFGVFSLLAAEALLAVVTVLFFAWLERASLGFKWLTPKVVSIYDPYFWAHERHWKLSDSPIVQMFKGTPFKNVVSRLVGVKMGRKVYDDGCITTERTLTHVGDYANLNEGGVIQPHSLEEGVFKSDHIQIGKGCTLGVGAFVHYGVAMHEQAVLDADSFLMKGEVLDPHSVWRGNPAKPICRRQVQDRFEAKLIDRLDKDEATSSLEPADAFVPKEAVE